MLKFKKDCCSPATVSTSSISPSQRNVFNLWNNSDLTKEQSHCLEVEGYNLTSKVEVNSHIKNWDIGIKSQFFSQSNSIDQLVLILLF